MDCPYERLRAHTIAVDVYKRRKMGMEERDSKKRWKTLWKDEDILQHSWAFLELSYSLYNPLRQTIKKKKKISFPLKPLT
jgi:hypothetical protein